MRSEDWAVSAADAWRLAWVDVQGMLLMVVIVAAGVSLVSWLLGRSVDRAAARLDRDIALARLASGRCLECGSMLDGSDGPRCEAEVRG